MQFTIHHVAWISIFILPFNRLSILLYSTAYLRLTNTMSHFKKKKKKRHFILKGFFRKFTQSHTLLFLIIPWRGNLITLEGEGARNFWINWRVKISWCPWHLKLGVHNNLRGLYKQLLYFPKIISTY